MSNAVFLLVKAQVLRETESKLKALRKAVIDYEYPDYLANCERAKLEAITTAEELDAYLRDSRRLSLQEWLDSLSWDDTQRS